MIVILKSIVKNKGIINISDISKGFYDWMKHGFPDFGDLGGFGLGRTVGSVLRHPNFLENPHSVAKEVCDHSM